MVAVSLFDVLARDKTAFSNDQPPAERLAQQLVESALADGERLRQYEREFTPTEWDDDGQALEITRSIYALFEKWAAETEEVLIRTRRLIDAGRAVVGAPALEDSYGLVCARLKFTPDMAARAMQQVRQGKFTPAKELRDELRARLRA